MKIIIVVGHKKSSPGAENKSYSLSEFEFNSQLALDIVDKFRLKNQEDEIVIAYRETTYMELPKQLNDLSPDLIVSLHCNAFDTHTNGCEVLYYHRSVKGKEVARIFQNKIVNLMENKDRGLKPITSEDRGGPLLRYTNAPCIIVEPFFIDNDDETGRATEVFFDGDLTMAYCESINTAVKYLKV